MTRRRELLFASCLLVACGCGGEGLIQPSRSLVSQDLEVTDVTLESRVLTAADLLADPLLRDMLAALRDERRADAIEAAVDGTLQSLAEEDIEAARERLADAFDAMDRYLSGHGADAEDDIHLDASERFLDEVEAMIDLTDPPDEKGRKHGNKRG